MLKATNIDVDMWRVTETDAQGNLVGTHTVAVKAGATAADAVQALVGARNPKDVK